MTHEAFIVLWTTAEKEWSGVKDKMVHYTEDHWWVFTSEDYTDPRTKAIEHYNKVRAEDNCITASVTVPILSTDYQTIQYTDHHESN